MSGLINKQVYKFSGHLLCTVVTKNKFSGCFRVINEMN